MNKKYAVAYNTKTNNCKQVVENLKKAFEKYQINADFIDINGLKSGYDFVFVAGGDGTILKCARYYAKSSTPIFGINTGRLGFLSQVSAQEIDKAVSEIAKGNFRIEERTMLESGSKTALNDFVIKGTTTGRTSRFTLKIDNRSVCDYLADGIIITTPTGSTAYGLSAGGPIISPALNAFVIVPICPHTLTVRPIVIPDNETISVCFEDKGKKYFASTDGQEFYEFSNEITIKKSEHNAKLVLLNDSNFYEVLRDKLHWGTSLICK